MSDKDKRPSGGDMAKDKSGGTRQQPGSVRGGYEGPTGTLKPPPSGGGGGSKPSKK